MDTHQRCARCKSTKAVDAFAKGRNRNGRQWWCRACMKAYQRARNEARATVQPAGVAHVSR